jgi:hypothetical protein
MVFIVPTWCGVPGQGDDQVAPLLKLGTLLDNTAGRGALWDLARRIQRRTSSTGNGRSWRTCWLPALDSGSDVGDDIK